MNFGLKQGDAGTPIMAVLYNPDGSAVDLTNATVRFKMAKSNDITVYSNNKIVYSGNQIEWDVKVNAKADIFSAEEGIVQYIFTGDDVQESGDFFGEFEVTYPNGRIETFPNGKSHIRICIYPDIR